MLNVSTQDTNVVKASSGFAFEPTVFPPYYYIAITDGENIVYIDNELELQIVPVRCDSVEFMQDQVRFLSFVADPQRTEKWLDTMEVMLHEYSLYLGKKVSL